VLRVNFAANAVANKAQTAIRLVEPGDVRQKTRLKTNQNFKRQSMQLHAIANNVKLAQSK
jgi:hypothetical protein